ncbi:MAG: hypothetical protein WAX12_20230 [Candidatus Microthrix subdominans]
MNHHNTPRTMRLFSVVALSGALLAGGCTDVEKADKGDPPKTPAAQATSASSGCAAYSDISMALGGEPEGDPATWFEETILPMADKLETKKPAEIDAELDTMIDSVRQVAESGDMADFETPEFAEAQAKVGRHMFDNCEFDHNVEVSGKEYAFEGIPETLTSGRVAILFTNDGMEAHEIVVASKKEGVTESFDELLEIPEEEAMTKIDLKGGAHTPQQGDESLLISDFGPGDYAALCFIPSGTMMHDGEEMPGDGPPHFIQGMKTEFTVT